MPVRRPTRGVHAELALLQRELNDLVGRLASTDAPARPGLGEWLPAVDVFDCRGKLFVVVEAPGLAAESLRVSCRSGKLAISGERREQRAPGGAGFLCMERPQGRFTRVIDLDLALDLAGAEAKLRDGLLIIAIPRLKDRRGRETIIPVEAERS
jgi:HSP20 family molecular chaperone IbpA